MRRDKAFPAVAARHREQAARRVMGKSEWLAVHWPYLLGIAGFTAFVTWPWWIVRVASWADNFCKAVRR